MKIVITILCIVAIGFGVYYVFDKTNPDSETKENGQIKDPSQEGADIEQKVYTFSVDGRSPKGVKQWHLEGKAAAMVDDVIHLEELTAVAFGEGVTVDFNADKGIYDREKGEVELIGNVEVRTQDGAVLNTDKATWSQVTREIFTDEIVKISKGDLSATGRGASASSIEKEAVFFKEISVKVGGTTAITCDGPLVVRFEDNMAVFSNNVLVEDEMNEGDLSADAMTVYFDAESKKIDRVEATGNVNVVSEEGGFLSTTKATWTQDTGEVSTDAEVYIKRDEVEARGKGAIANIEKKHAVLLSEIYVRFEPDTIIKSNGSLEIDFNENIAIFSDGVEVEDKEGKLYADKISVEFDSASNKIARVKAEGNVKLSKGQSYTLCEKAVYTEGTGSVQFLGKPRVVIDPNEFGDSGFMPSIGE
jgi:LPS export ABC transporter protein LptC